MPPDSAERLAIRELVFAFVDERKQVGWPPERVIVGVKQLARDADIRPSRRAIERDARFAPADVLLIEMVHWCIDRYYSVSPVSSGAQPLRARREP
jgi:hypothetical protein